MLSFAAGARSVFGLSGNLIPDTGYLGKMLDTRFKKNCLMFSKFFLISVICRQKVF